MGQMMPNVIGYPTLGLQVYPDTMLRFSWLLAFQQGDVGRAVPPVAAHTSPGHHMEVEVRRVLPGDQTIVLDQVYPLGSYARTSESAVLRAAFMIDADSSAVRSRTVGAWRLGMI